MKKISILVPVFNEQGNIPDLERRIDNLIKKLEHRIQFEVIVLDNCSSDLSQLMIKNIVYKNSAWKYIRYSRNFGYHNSLACGYDVASGDALVVVQADLQDPPELIEKMIDLWEEGNDIVYGVLLKRNDYSILKTIGAKIFYRLIYFMGEIKFPINATDFRLVDRKVIDAVSGLKEPDRYLRGLVAWVGFKSVGFYYDRDKRVHGKSIGDLYYCLKYGLNGIVAFSDFPLRCTMYIGITIILGCFAASIYFIWLHFHLIELGQRLPTGQVFLILLILFSMGLNALFLGVIGEYVGRIYNQGKKRPLYIIEERINI